MHRKHSSKLLSLFLDQELHDSDKLQQNIAQCLLCQKWLATVKQVSSEIEKYEQEQNNKITLEIFHVPLQLRKYYELDIIPKFFYCSSLQLLESLNFSKAIKLYLRYFRYQSLGVYLEKNSLENVYIQRGQRHIRVKNLKSYKVIPDDSILVFENGEVIAKMMIQIPKIYRENSVSRKMKALTLSSQSFIQLFFEERKQNNIEHWFSLKATLHPRDLAIYLMHLRKKEKYRTIARCFQVTPHHVAKVIWKIRIRFVSF